MTIKVLSEQGESDCATARLLGVSEGTVRYHRRRLRTGAADGRAKAFLIEPLTLEDAVGRWWHGQLAMLPDGRPPSVEALHAWLVEEHGYPGSYKSVRRFVRARFPAPRRRPFSRMETPPGTQAQSDWTEFRR